MKKIFRISRWEDTEEGFVEIEPVTFEFGMCKVGNNLHLCINGIRTQKINFSTFGNKFLLEMYKKVLDGEFSQKAKLLSPSKILLVKGESYFNELFEKVMMDKRCNKRDLITEVFGKPFKN